MNDLLQPTERVLSTLNADGSRRWLDPKPVSGPLRARRHILGWVLVAVFVTLPHLHRNGQQLFFMNVAKGEFTVFGQTFIRTDTLLLALSMLTVAVSIFLLTAMFGRVWCGWACPQTVYLEFVFRPLGTLFNGKGRKGLHGLVSRLPGVVRKPAYLVLFLLICFGLANTFLAYFVGSRPLMEWVTNPPWEHWFGFGFVMLVTGLMVFNFGFFREQLCIIACPYGRMQSVLLDRESLIVGYDEKRGEPRGKIKRKRASGNGDVSLKVVDENGGDEPALGDCVACTRCVQVCPTGIDIRDGLQLECIHCARCIDACNDVMGKLGRELGLIRYSSQSALAGGKRHALRPRVVIYPVILLVLLGVTAGLVATKSDTDISVFRSQGIPFNVLPTGEVTNQVRVRVTNRGDSARAFLFLGATDGVRIQADEPVLALEPGQTDSMRLLLVAQPGLFETPTTRVVAKIRVQDETGFQRDVPFRLMAPLNLTPPPNGDPIQEGSP